MRLEPIKPIAKAFMRAVETDEVHFNAKISRRRGNEKTASFCFLSPVLFEIFHYGYSVRRRFS